MRWPACAASRGMSEEEARARLANQSPQDEKVAAADVVIDGSAPLDETRRQVGMPTRRRGSSGRRQRGATGVRRRQRAVGSGLSALRCDRRHREREVELVDQAVDGRAAVFATRSSSSGRSTIVNGPPAAVSSAIFSAVARSVRRM